MGKNEEKNSRESESVTGLGSGKAVGKTMSILEFLAKHRSATLGDICSGTDMNKSTGYRFLAALKQLGYVRQDDAGTYSPSIRLAQLGMLVSETIDLLSEGHPVIERLAERTQETVHLATLEEGHLVYLDKVESTRNLRVAMKSRVGSGAPTYCTGVGKALLAYSHPSLRRKVLQPESLVKHTPNTIVDSSQLEKELEQVRSQGYAIDNEEHEVGVRCVAAPILDKSRTAIAAISISAPSVRLTEAHIPKYQELVTEAARELETRTSHGSTL